jgi:hypothetical protein
MLKCYWIVAALVGLLWYKNTRYAIKQYLANRHKLIFTLYMSLLGGLGYLIIHVTTRVMTLAQASRDVLTNL